MAYAEAKRTVMEYDVDVAAPMIIVPEDPELSSGCLFMANLGHIEVSHCQEDESLGAVELESGYDHLFCTLKGLDVEILDLQKFYDAGFILKRKGFNLESFHPWTGAQLGWEGP